MSVLVLHFLSQITREPPHPVAVRAGVKSACSDVAPAQLIRAMREMRIHSGEIEASAPREREWQREGKVPLNSWTR